MDSNADQSLTPVAAQSPRRPHMRALTMRLADLRVSQKLTIIGGVFAIPLGVLLTLFVANQQASIAFSSKEAKGIAFVTPLNSLQTHVWQHAEAVANIRGGDASNKTAGVRKAMLSAVEKDLAALAAAQAANPGILPPETLETLKLNWDAVKESTMLMGRDAVIASHADFTEKQLQAALGVVANNSNLILDPNIDSYYAMNTAVNLAPNLRRLFDQMRLEADSAFQRGTTTVQERLQLAAQVATAEKIVEEVIRGMEYATASDKRLEKTFGASALNLKSTAQGYLQGLRQLAEGGSSITVDPEGLRELGRSAADAALVLNNVAQKDLKSLVDQRVSSLERARNLSLLGVLAGLAFAFALLVVIARAIIKPLTQLETASRELGRGNLGVQVDVNSNDEIGIVSRTFNDAIEQLREVERRNAIEREEAQLMQQNIGAFLDVTMDIAEGDFTKRGTVTEDILGNVVDSINVMVEELAYVLQSVQDAARSVNEGADSMLSTTDEIVRGSDMTATEAQRVAQEVQGVTASIRQMADSAGESAQTAQLALQASQQGQTAVESTLAGMQNIRREVQGISKRIKGLGDRSLEIQEIVDTISRISSQTNLLALNAAIEAAGAGEAGARFAIVADEVRKLAESSASATARIATLIKSVQSEIQEVVVSVEDGTREVESGYRVAGTAGERLAEIAQLAQRSAELALSISEATQQQVQGVEQVGGAVGSIASIAERARESVLAGRAAAERLRQLADDMNAQLARFRISS